MGMIGNFGRIAETYMNEKEKLLHSDDSEIRKRTFMGHLFWPHEVLRDTIILLAITATLAFYSYLIPPPLHSAADPIAQAGFVFPDWYVLFSYGYLRWGEYLPQFDIPLGPIGALFNQPIYPMNAGAWGIMLTGLPVGILALPPILGGTAKRGVEDPWFATAGVIYLAHVWFISVFSINIFLDLYGKNRIDACKVDHGELICGIREPWIADVFNAVPWILTGILIWILIYFVVRTFLLSSIGARTTPLISKNIIIGGFIIALVASVSTFDYYERGFWEMKGLGAMDDIDTLEKMYDQPLDYVIEHDSDWAQEGEVITTKMSSQYHAIVLQPTNYHYIDFLDVNNHQNSELRINSMVTEGSILESFSNSENETSGSITITNMGLDSVPLKISCKAKTSVRNVGLVTSSLEISKNSEMILSSDCSTDVIEFVTPGEYIWELSVDPEGIDSGSEIYTNYTAEISVYQPLLVYNEGHANEGQSIDLSSEDDESTYEMLVNPAYKKNPKSLDAKLIYSLFIPCITLGALVFILLRSMARGYEYEMNKCYGCDLCDDACPVRLFNAGDKLNIIYNTWNNEDDGVPMYTCLTCSACTNVCPQLVDYDSYVDIRRSLTIGIAPEAEIPHTILRAVLNAEIEDGADDNFVSVEEYPLDSNIGYYPGCVDFIDEEMVFSHVNEGSMNLGASTSSAFTLFEEMGEEVTYLGRDFLKCCGHDQKWQGMTEVFEKLKSYNEKKLKESGIDTLVSSCAECFRTFAKDYELEDIKIMHTTEFLIEKGFDMDLKTEQETTVTYHDPCRLGRQIGLYEEPRNLIKDVDGVELVEMEHHGEDALCCGVSSMMACNENSRSVRLERFEEVRATGAEVMLTSCPKCVSHFECLKFEGDPAHNFEILDVVTFLARQVDEKKNNEAIEGNTTSLKPAEV